MNDIVSKLAGGGRGGGSGSGGRVWLEIETGVQIKAGLILDATLKPLDLLFVAGGPSVLMCI